jgi:hypothetical protein
MRITLNPVVVLTRGPGFAPVTLLEASMSPASQLPVVELIVKPDTTRVTSSNEMEYCGAQASRAMRFCGGRGACRRSALMSETDCRCGAPSSGASARAHEPRH